MASSSDVIAAYQGVLRRDPLPSDFTNYASWPAPLMQDDVIGSTENKNEVQPIIRLYSNAFGRAPDDGGLDYWVGRFRDLGISKASLTAIVEQFLPSTEAQLRFPDSDSSVTYVGKLYTYILGRTGDLPGITYWADQIDNNTLTRAQVFVEFSESTEAVSRMASVIYSFQLSLAQGDTSVYGTVLI